MTRGAVWFGVPLVAIAAGAYVVVPRASTGQAKPDRSAPRAIPVATSVAKKGDLDLYLTALGTVAAFNTVAVRTRVDGEIFNVAFTEGQHVNEGDLLFEIDPRPFKVQLAQAQGNLERDLAEFKNARLQLERLRTARDAFSDQQIDTQAAVVMQIEGQVKVDQAAIDQANLLLTFSRIRAPISGRIGLRMVDKGNFVRSNANNTMDREGLAIITQVRPIAVLFAVPQTEIARVVKRPGGGAGLPAEVYDRDLRTKLATGKLLTHDNAIDPATGTLRFKAEVPNEDGTLFPNQFVNVRLLVDTRKDTVMVPPSAIQRSPKATFVYVVKPDFTVDLREVVAGAIEGDIASIESGVAPGEVVVTEGLDKLLPGSKVTTPDAAPAKGGEMKGRKKPR